MRMRALLTALFVSLGVSAVALSACNTTEGFGKDVKNTGSAIEKKADESK